MKKRQHMYGRFSEELQVSKETAKRIVDRIYEKELDATQLARVLWKLQNWLVKKNIRELFEKLTDDQIDETITEIMVEDQRMRTGPCEVQCYNFKEERSLWIFNEIDSSIFKEYKAGDTIEMQIMRTGKWNHPLYGEVNITREVLDDVVNNFKENKRGIKIVADENHEDNHKALAIFEDVFQKGKDAVYSVLKLTKKGADLLTEGAYMYFSPEILWEKTDEESGETVENLLIGGAFTNRPFFKAMEPFMANEAAAQRTKDNSPASSYIFINQPHMKTILELLAQFSELTTITKAQRDELKAAYDKLAPEDKHAEMTAAIDGALAKFNEETVTPPATEPAKADNADDGEGAADGAADGADDGEQGEGDDSEKAKSEEEKKAEADDADPKTEKPKTEESIKASEDKMISIKMSEYNLLKERGAANSTKIREVRAQLSESKATSLAFSETNPDGVILPKDVPTVASFAASLSEAQEKQFFSIIEKFQGVSTRELGTGADGGAQNYSEEDKNYYIQKFGYSEEEAIKHAKEAFKQ